MATGTIAADSSKPVEQMSEFEWIQLTRDINAQSIQQEESAKDKFIRKTKENPFVPIGCGLTAAALSYGLWNFRQGKSQMSQYMMRMRIGAQGFTVVALLVGIGLSATKDSS